MPPAPLSIRLVIMLATPGRAAGIGRGAAAEDEQGRGDRHVGRAGDDDAHAVRQPPFGEGGRGEGLLRPGRGRRDALALRRELVRRARVGREGPAQSRIGMRGCEGS